MGAGRFVGRVGGLAVALGVGIAAASVGMTGARADDTAAGQTSSAGQTAGSTDSAPRAKRSGASSHAGKSRSTRAPRSAPEPDAAPPAERPDVTSRVAAEPGDTDAGAAPKSRTRSRSSAERTPRVAVTPDTDTAPVSGPSTPAGATVERTFVRMPARPALAPPPAPAPASDLVGLTAPAEVTETATPATQSVTMTSAVESGSSLLGDNPAAPLLSSAVVLLAAASRREIDTDLEAGARTVAAVPQNSAPTLTPVVNDPNPVTGVVTGTLGAVDPDGDALTFKASPSKGTITFAPNGTFSYTPKASARHAAAVPGARTSTKTDTFTVTVTDAHGASTRASITVAIAPANSAPTVSAAEVTGTSSWTGSVTGKLTVTDADKDWLSYSATATNGKVRVSSSGRFTYTPTSAARHAAAQSSAPVTDTVHLTVTDGHGGTVTRDVAVVILPKNSAPGAIASVKKPESTLGTVLGKVTAWDFDKDVLTYSAPATTGRGAVTINSGTGEFSYTPTAQARHAAARVGAPRGDKTDTFTVTIADGHGGVTEKVVTVTISPKNAAPTVAAAPTVGHPAAVTGVVTGTLGAADPDGDTLTFKASPRKGAITFTGADGSFTYTPTAKALADAAKPGARASAQADTFTVTVSDGYGGTTTQSVTVSLVSHAPALGGAGGNVNAAPGSPAKLFSTITVADPDNTNLTGATVAITAGRQVGADVLALTPSAQNGITGSYNAGTGVLTLTGTASVANYQAALRSITFTNTSGAPALGARTVTVTVTDGELTSNTITLTATLRVNHAPVAVSDAFTGAEDTAVKGNVLTNDTDADLDTLTTMLGIGAAHGTVNLAANGSFTYTPYVNYHGTDSFTYTASDGYVAGNATTVTITITPVDDVLFTFNYGTGSQYWTPAAKAALQAAANRLSELIATTSPVTITYDVSAEYTPGGAYLARGGSGIASSSPGFYQTTVQRKIQSATHYDQNGSAADGTLLWNFGYTYSYDDTPASNELDFQNVAIHELLHSFGFNTYTSAPGATNRYWFTYDSFLVDQNGAKVIGSDYRYKTAYDANLLGNNGGLYFGGPHAVAVYGGPVPLQPGSVSHLRGSVFVGANNKIMSPVAAPYGTNLRTLSPLELAMLMDLGYTIAGTVPATSAAAAPDWVVLIPDTDTAAIQV